MHKENPDMFLEKLSNELINLNRYETIGKKHFEKYGKNISHLHLMYLMSYGEHITEPDELYTDFALDVLDRIYEYHVQHGTPGMLSDSRFLPSGKNLEIQKLLRYVDIAPHQHEFIECAFVVTGRCLHRINEREYIQEGGSFVTIPLGFSHVLFPEDDCLCLTMKVRFETFRNLNLPGWANFAFPLVFPCGSDPFVRNTIASIWSQQERDLPYSEQIMEQLFKTLIFYLEQNFREDMQYLVTHADTDPRMVEIIGFMVDNFQSVTLKTVAEHFHYSPAYLSRMIHEGTGRTFSSLLKEYKLRQAAALIQNGMRKLADVCDAVGYKDTVQFIHSFKDFYGVTPGQYRKQHQEQ